MIGSIEWIHLRQVLYEYADYFIELAQADLMKNDSFATGTLYDTMRSIVQIYDDHYEVDIELQDYWYYVEHGRNPGKFPPPNKIKDWIIAKPVMPYTMKNGKLPTTDQLTFLISRKIATEGIDPRPFFEKNKNKTYAHFKDAIAEAIDMDVADYIEQTVIRGEAYKKLFEML